MSALPFVEFTFVKHFTSQISMENVLKTHLPDQLRSNTDNDTYLEIRSMTERLIETSFRVFSVNAANGINTALLLSLLLLRIYILFKRVF